MRLTSWLSEFVTRRVRNNSVTRLKKRTRKQISQKLEWLEDRALLAVDLSVNFSTGTEAAGTVVTVTATNDTAVSGAQTVDLAVTGTGITGSDYSLSASQITIANGAISGSVTFTILNDNLVELTEAATLTISNPSSGIVLGGTTSQNVTITDNDSAVVSISSPNVTEGGTLAFSVTISKAVDVAVTADRATSDGTATTGDSDYTGIGSGNVTLFAAGSTTPLTINVATTGDSTVELNEALSLILSTLAAGGRAVTFNGGGGTLTGTGTINNDDSAVVSISSPNVTEGGMLAFSVTINNPVDVVVTANRATSDGTATTGDSDYTAIASGNVTLFAADSTTPLTINVITTTDNKVELNEALSLILSTLSAGGRSVTFNGGLSTLTGTGTINNDDSAVVSISSPSVTEGGTLAFSVTINNPVDVAVTANRATADGTATTADSDYTAISSGNTTLFAAGSTTPLTINVVTTGDGKVELNEALSLILSTLGAGSRSVTFNGGLSTLAGTGTINNDDSAVVSISSPSVTESGALAFSVTINNPVDVAVTANRATADGTATTGDSDFTAITSSNVTLFAAGSTTPLTINVNTTNDNKVELDETLSLILSTLSAGGRSVTFNGGLSTLAGTGTINNNDTASISISDVTANENGTFTFTVTSSNPSDQNLTGTINTASGTATSGTDFTAISGGTFTITGNGSATTTTVTVTVSDDTKVEGSENFNVNLTSPLYGGAVDGTRATISDGTGVGTITDNDTAVITFTNPSTSISEGGTSTTFNVTLTITANGTPNTGTLDRAVSFDVSTVGGGTATGGGVDYTFSTQSYSFPIGTASNSTSVVNLGINEDLKNEGSETANFGFSNFVSGAGSQVTTSGTQTVTITDNDSASAVVFDAPTGGAGTDAFRIVLNGTNLEFYDNAVLIDSRAFSTITGSLTINGANNELDTLNVDLSGGDIIPAGGIIFNGGTGANVDALTITGGSQGDVTYTYLNANDGSVAMTNYGTITYTGLEPITNTGTATNIVFTLPGATDSSITLANLVAGTSARLTTTVPSFEQTDFAIPIAGGSITINLGGNDQTITVNSLTLNGTTDLIIDGGAGTDVINLNAAGMTITDALTLSAETIAQTGAVTVAGLTTLTSTTAGTITLTQATNNFQGAVSIVSANSASIDDTNGITFGSVTTQAGFTVDAGGAVALNGATSVGGALDVQANANAAAGGAISGSGAISVTGTTTLETGTPATGTNDITLNNAANNFVGNVTIISANDVTLSETGGINIAAATISNTSSITSTGAITDSGNISVTNGATFSGTSITLGDAGGETTNFGTLTFTSTGAVAITEDSQTDLTGTNTANILNLTSSAAIVDATTTSLTVTNAATLSGTSITLGDTVGDTTNFGTLTFTSAGTVSITEDSDMNLTGTNTAGTLTLTTDNAGNTTTLTVGGTSTTATGTVTLNAEDGATINVPLQGTAITISSDTDGDATGILTNIAAGTIHATAGAVTITASDVSLAGTVTATTDVLLQTSTPIRTIGLAGGVGNFGVDDAEADLISASRLVIGTATSGAITVGAAFSPTTPGTLHLLTNGGVSGAGSFTIGNLAISANGTVSLTNANSVTNLAIVTGTGSISFTESSSLNVADVVTPSGTISGVRATAPGAVTLTVTAGNLTVQNTSDPDDISATTFTATVSGVDAVFNLNASADVQTTVGVTITADDLDIQGSITASAQTVLLQPNAASQLINVGSAGTSANGTLELSDPELDRVTAGTIQIGRASAGALTVSAAIDTLNTTTLHLIAGSTVSQTGAGAITEGSLAISAGGAVSMNTNANTVNNLAISTTTGNINFTNNATVSVTTVDAVAGMSTVSGSITLLNNTGDVTVVNTASAIDVSATTGITITLSANNAVFTVNATADVETTGNVATNDIIVNADEMDLSGTVKATGSNQIVTLRNTTLNKVIVLGANPGTANTLELNDAELDNVSAGNVLRIGRNDASASGNISFQGAVTAPAGWTVLKLITGAAISDDNAANPDITVANLAVNSVSGIAAAGTDSTNGLEILVTNLAFNNTTSNSVQFTEATGGLGYTINSVDGVLTSNNGGTTTTLTANSPVTFAVNDISVGSIVVNATETATTNFDNITVNAGVTVQSTTGDVTFNAGDRIVLSTSTSTVQSNTGSVTLNSGVGDTDNDGQQTLDGLISAAGTVTINLNQEANAGATQAVGGTITATNLRLLSSAGTPGGGAFALGTSTTNDVTTLAAATDGAIVYRDATNLIIGTVTTVGVTTSNDDILLQTGGSLTINNVLNSGTGDIRLVIATTVTQAAAGNVVGDELGIRAGGVVTLSTSAANDVNSLAVNTTDVVEFRDVDDLTISTVTASGNFLATSGITTTNDNVNLRTGTNLVVNQVITVGTADVRIVAGDNGVSSITQNAAGVITADELGILATRNVGLAAAQSDVNTISVNATNGTIDFIDSDDLVVGAVAAGGTNGFTGATGITSGGNDVYLETNGAGGTLTISNAINTGAGDLRLEASAATTQTAAITATGLALTDQGPFTLTLVTNSVTTLAANSANTIAYVNAGSLIVGTVTIQTTSIGPVNTVGISTSNDDVRIVATTGSITINNTINLSNGGGGGSGGSLDLVATTGATQAGAANILANNLLLRGTGAAINTNVFNLPNATNNVAIIAANLTNGAITYFDADALTVGISSVTAGGSTTTATGITVGNPVSVAPAGGDVFLRAGQVAPFTGLLTVTQIIDTNAGTFGNLTLGGGVVFSGAGNTNVGSGDIDLEGGAAVPDIVIDNVTTHNMTGGTVTYRPDRDIFINRSVTVNNGNFILDADGEGVAAPTIIAGTTADLAPGNGVGGVWIRDQGSIDVNTGTEGGGSLVIAGSQINNTPNGGAAYVAPTTLAAGAGVQIDNTTAATEVTAATTIAVLVKTITGLGSAVNDLQIDGNIVADAGGPINVQVEDTMTLNGTISLTTEGNITIDAEDMVINTATAVIDAKETVANNGSGIVWLRNRTAGRQIDVGGTLGGARLTLTNAELNRINQAEVVRIGRNGLSGVNTAAGAGTISVTAMNINLTPAGGGTQTVLHLITSADITDTGANGSGGLGTITETNVALEAGTGIDLHNVNAVAGSAGNDVDNLAILLTGGDGVFKDRDDVNFQIVDFTADTTTNAVNVTNNLTMIMGGNLTQTNAVHAGGLELIDLFNGAPPPTFTAFPTYYLPHSSNTIGNLEAYSQRSVNITNSTTLTVGTVANSYLTFPATGSSGVWVQSLQLTAPTVVTNLPIETNDELGFVTFDVTTLLDINANIFSRGKIEQIGTGVVTVADVELRTTDDNITFLGGVTLDGASLVTPTTMSTDANWTTPFTGIPLAANAAATTGGGNVIFNSTLRSNPSGDTAAAYRGNDLTLETGTGNIQFIGQVGGASGAAGRLGVMNIVDAHDVTASTGFSANAIYQQAGDGETAFNGFVQTNGRRDVLTPTVATNFGVDITTKMITLNAGMQTTSAPGSGAAAAIRLNNSGTMSIVAGAGSINSDGAVSQVGTGNNLVGGDIVTTNDNISFLSDTYLSGSPIQINSQNADVSFAARFQINNKTVTIRDKDFVDLGTVTAIAGGILNVFVANTATRGSIQAGSGETITGAGTMNTDVSVLTGGTLAPAMDASGLGTGILTVNGNVVLGTNAVYAVDLNGTVAGSSYDQVVTGATFTFTSTGAILSATRPVTFNPATNSVLKIIDGSVDVVGNFANAANGTYVYINGLYFRVDYDVTAGDLTLTRLDPPGAAVTIIDDNGSSPSTPVAGFTVTPNNTATWSPNSVAGRGYANDLRFAAPGTGSSTALYTFTGLVSGHTYRVSTTWFPHINRATDSPFTVDDGAGGSAAVTTTVNQRNSPDDFTSGGSAWEDLVVGGYTISSTTLTVLLTNNTSTGYVIADAVRIEDVTGAAPEIVVTESGNDIADGTGVVDFGTTSTVGADVTKTISIKNTGLSPLVLSSATITPPPGFSISGYTPQTIAPGATGTPFTITLSHLVAGNFSGQISFNTNDFDENPFNFTIKGGVTTGATLIADNLAAGTGFNTITGAANNAGTNLMYGEVGLWHNNDDSLVGYQQDLRYANANSNSQASWTFSGLATGTYRVSVTFRAESNRASNASFTVTGTGVASPTTIQINQRVAPNQFQDANVYWIDLAPAFGTISAGGTITVTLDALGSNGFVIADAVRVEFLHPLQAEEGPAANPTATVLTAADLDAIAAAAVARWQQAGLTAAQQSALNGITFAIVDLPDAYLGSETDETIFIDPNAAGYGWYVDSTPYDDAEFGLTIASTELGATDPVAADGMDLLTVLMHEIGHRLGLDDVALTDDAHGLMAESIDVGTRRLPVVAAVSEGDVDAECDDSSDTVDNDVSDEVFYTLGVANDSAPSAVPTIALGGTSGATHEHRHGSGHSVGGENGGQRHPHRTGGKPHDDGTNGSRSLLGALFNFVRNRK